MMRRETMGRHLFGPSHGIMGFLNSDRWGKHGLLGVRKGLDLVEGKGRDVMSLESCSFAIFKARNTRQNYIQWLCTYTFLVPGFILLLFSVVQLCVIFAIPCTIKLKKRYIMLACFTVSYGKWFGLILHVASCIIDLEHQTLSAIQK